MDILKEIKSEAAKIFLGKDEVIEQATCCLLAEGHLLIEDIPGVGKTTLVKLLAQVFGLDYSRIQFTNDLLPSDILGGHIFIKDKGEFEFRKGPIFGEIVLADELNRAPPKTQSALLQAMEEQAVTIEREKYELPNPFIVMATQNPRYQIGTFPLPESQLDRFMMKIRVGFPSKEKELEILKSPVKNEEISTVRKVLDKDKLLDLRKKVKEVTVSEPILEFAHSLLDHTRSNSHYNSLSPRAGQDLIQASRAWAFIHAKGFVTPEDVQKVFPLVCSHRLSSSTQDLVSEYSLSEKIIQSVDIK